MTKQAHHIERGKSPIDLSSLLEDTLRPRPAMPDSVTFSEHPDFVGDEGQGLFPRQRALMRLIFLEKDQLTPYESDVIEKWREGFVLGPDRWGLPYDTWERVEWLRKHGRLHFSSVIFVGGRRAGKGHLGALCAAHEMYRLLQMGDPQAHYGLARGKHLRTLITATNYPQARDNEFADLFNLVANGACFRPSLISATKNHITLATDADIARYAQMDVEDVQILRQLGSLRATAISSNAPAARGTAANMIVFDEFAHFLGGTGGMRTAEEVYRALTPSLDQMGGDGLIYIPTSPWTKVSFAYSLYEAALSVDEAGHAVHPDMLVVQLPSWGPYEDWDDLEATEGRIFVSAPQRYDETMLRVEKLNPRAFKAEYRSQWPDVEDGYVDPAMVDRMLLPFCPRHGTAIDDGGTCQVCGSPARVLGTNRRGVMAWSYRGHADPSKSQANFAVLIAHTEPFENEDGHNPDHVIVDFAHVWRPEDSPDHQVPYDRIVVELADMVIGFPALRTFTFDQYGSFATVALMRELLRQANHRARIVEENFNERANAERAERFKSILGMGWVHAYRDDLGPDGKSLLELELKCLQERNGKVVHQVHGPIITKDLADCLMVVSAELLKDQLDRGLPRQRLGHARLLSAPGFHNTPGALAPRARLKEIVNTHHGNPYGRYVPPDPPVRRNRWQP